MFCAAPASSGDAISSVSVDSTAQRKTGHNLPSINDSNSGSLESAAYVPIRLQLDGNSSSYVHSTSLSPPSRGPLGGNMLDLGEQAVFFLSARPLASPMTPTPEAGQDWIGAPASRRNHGSHHRAQYV